MKKLKIEYWPVENLTPYEKNPRRNDEVVGRMADSLKKFGFRIPIIATADGEILDGHLRYKAALSIGLKTVPITRADELSPEEIKAFRLVANHSATWAEWEPGLLATELDELKSIGFDIEQFGLDEILPELGEIQEVETTTRAPRKRTTLFISVLNADAEKAREIIAKALTKAKIESSL